MAKNNSGQIGPGIYSPPEPSRLQVIWAMAVAALLIAVFFIQAAIGESLRIPKDIPADMGSELMLRRLIATYEARLGHKQVTRENYFAQLNDEIGEETGMQLERQAAGLESQRKQLGNDFALQMENQIQRFEKRIAELEAAQAEPNRIQGLKEDLNSIRTWYPSALIAVYPQRFPVLIKNFELEEQAARLVAIQLAGYGLNTLFTKLPELPAGGGCSPPPQEDLEKPKPTPQIKNGKPITFITAKKGKKVKRKALTITVPNESVLAYNKFLAKHLPNADNKKIAESLVDSIDLSPYSSWLKDRVRFQTLAYFYGIKGAEQKTGYLNREDQFVNWLGAFIPAYSFLLILGAVWFIIFRFQSRQSTGFPVVLAPSFRRCLYYSSFFVIIHFTVQTAVFLIGSQAGFGQMETIFAASLLSMSIGLTVVLRPLFREYDITLRKFIQGWDLLYAQGKVPAIFVWGFGGFCVSLTLIYFLQMVLSALGLPGAEQSGGIEEFAQLSTQLDYILLFIAVCVIAPIFEELFFRAYLLSGLLKRFPVWQSIFISSLIFGIIHGQPAKALPLTALGAILAFIRLRSGSILAPMLVHSFWNLQNFFMLYIINQ